MESRWDRRDIQKSKRNPKGIKNVILSVHLRSASVHEGSLHTRRRHMKKSKKIFI